MANLATAEPSTHTDARIGPASIMRPRPTESHERIPATKQLAEGGAAAAEVRAV